MSSLKSFLTAGCLTIGVFGVILYSSCSKKDACEMVTCQNGGTCLNGSCSCPTGYEGANCETRTISKFTGNWSVTEILSLGGTNTTLDSTKYIVAINAKNNTTTTDLLIDNISNAGSAVRLNAKVSGNNIIVDSATDTESGKTYEVPTATLSGNTINIRFRVTDAATGALEKDRTATLAK